MLPGQLGRYLPSYFHSPWYLCTMCIFCFTAFTDLTLYAGYVANFESTFTFLTFGFNLTSDLPVTFMVLISPIMWGS